MEKQRKKPIGEVASNVYLLYKKAFCLILFLSLSLLTCYAQDIVKRDTTLEMKEVTVTARSEIRKLKESAMPISVIGQRQLQGTVCLSIFSWQFRQKRNPYEIRQLLFRSL